MIRRVCLVPSVVVLLIAVAGCAASGKDSASASGGAGSSRNSQPTTTSSVAYTCTMHPEVVTSQPGKCPKCGMSLVAKK